MAVYVYRYIGAAARFVERAWRRHKAVSVFFGQNVFFPVFLSHSRARAREREKAWREREKFGERERRLGERERRLGDAIVLSLL